jgi:hypothetical protein
MAISLGALHVASHAMHVPVDEDVVEGEFHDKVDQRLLDARGRCCILHAIARLAAEKTDGVC